MKLMPDCLDRADCVGAMISTIAFSHGIKRCFTAPGEPCRWNGATGFGTRPVCILFDAEPLREDDERWLLRCPQCVKEFGETK